jgi:hypothetical protein
MNKIQEVTKKGKIIHQTMKAVLFHFEKDKEPIWLPRTSFTICKREKDIAIIKISLRFYNNLHANQQPS